MRSVGLSVLALTILSTVACSTASDADGVDDAATEQNLGGGITQFGSKLEDPDSLTQNGDNVYFVTNYGFATQAEAAYNHDIWVKQGSSRAKRLYKKLYGASWGMVATKNGIYEINEGTASVRRYPLDGSNSDGENVIHAIYGEDEEPDVGIRALAADDDGVVVSIRDSRDEMAPNKLVALTPTGKNQTDLGSVPNGAPAIKLAGKQVYVGTATGELLVGDRSSGAFKKIATGEGKVAEIAVDKDDVYFVTDKGVFVKRAAGADAEKLVPEGATTLTVTKGQVVFGEWKSGLYTVPTGGGAKKLVLEMAGPSSILAKGSDLFVTDREYGECHEEEEGMACPFDGKAFKISF